MPFAVNQRVRISIKDRDSWHKPTCDAVQGTTGVVEEVKPNYEYPVRGKGVGPPITGYLVAFGAPIDIIEPSDPSRVWKTISAFHFSEGELEEVRDAQ